MKRKTDTRVIFLEKKSVTHRISRKSNAHSSLDSVENFSTFNSICDPSGASRIHTQSLDGRYSSICPGERMKPAGVE